MADATKRRFEAAVNVVKSMPKKGAYQPSYDTMLKFYGYFKQSKEGECTDSKPGFWDVIKKAKWEAWYTLGDLSRQDAMESYVNEVKKVMETMPENEEMADFSLVLKEFYETVYEPEGAEPPPMLRIFKKDNIYPVNGTQLTIIDKTNGCTPNNGNYKQERQCINGIFKQNAQYSDNSVEYSHQNGPLNNGKEHFSENGHETSVDWETIEASPTPSNSYKKGIVNGHNDLNDIEGEDVMVFNDITIEPSQPLYIVEVGDKSKKASDLNDSGFPGDFHINRDFEVPKLKAVQSSTATPQDILVDDEVTSASDESDEEFCDSLDPEHLISLQNGSSAVSFTNSSEIKGIKISESSSSPDQSSRSPLTESDVSDAEMPDVSYERCTSTPFSKKAAHVTFAEDVKEESKKLNGNGNLSAAKNLEVIYPVSSGENPVGCISEGVDGGVLEPSEGILKPKQAGSGYRGGSRGKGQSTSRGVEQGGSQGQKDDRTGAQGTEPNTGGSSTGGYKDFSDSDTDDDHHNGLESGDSSAERDETNERILIALEKLQQDMNRVLRRLRTMEDTVPSRTDVLERTLEPWWRQFVPSKTVAFLILWPFVINLIFHYYRRRKSLR